MAPAKCRGHPLQCGPDVVSVVRCADEVDVERRQHGVDQRLVDGLGAAIETEHAQARRGVAAAADPQLAVRVDGERAQILVGETIDDHRCSVAAGIEAIQAVAGGGIRSEEHTSELQSLMRISYAVFCLKKKKSNTQDP